MAGRRPPQVFRRRAPPRKLDDRKGRPEARLQRIVNRSLKRTYPNKCKLRDTDPEYDEYTGKRGGKNIGRPDIVGGICGLHIEIELKVSNNYPTDQQKEQLRQVARSGGLSFVITHHRKENTYWLIPWYESKINFSYRDRAEWIILPWYEVEDNIYLNMKALHAFIVGHMATLKTEYLNETNPGV